jgi:hypothetical protein
MSSDRIRSLGKEKEDHNAFRHHRSRLVGHSVSNEYYQQTPFFYTRENAQINLVGNWRGASAFLICNGPSLVSGRYNLNLLKLPGVLTFGINNGPATIRPNFWTCVDDPKRFLKSIWLDPTIMKFVPHAHAEKPLFDNEKWEDLKLFNPFSNKEEKVLVGQCPNMFYYHRNSKFMANRFLFEDTINWGNHKDFGGGRSVMLPALRILFLLGFRKVYLIGADFNMSENYTYHFDEQRAKGAVRCNMGTYDRMKNEYFPQLKQECDAEGFNIYNCTEGSKLDVFPFVKYEDAISDIINPLGDIFNTRTWGLYSDPKKRGEFKDEPDDEYKAHLETISKKPNNVIYATEIKKKNNVEQGNEITQKSNVEVQPSMPVNSAEPVQTVASVVEDINEEEIVTQNDIKNNQTVTISKEDIIRRVDINDEIKKGFPMTSNVNTNNVLLKKKPCMSFNNINEEKQNKKPQPITIEDNGF